MKPFWKRQTNDSTEQPSQFTWDEQARQGLEQALKQAPVPTMLRGKVKKEFKRAAEEAARQAGRTTVTAQDLMNGMLAKMPANMRQQVEDAMKKGPDGLENLAKKLRG